MNVSNRRALQIFAFLAAWTLVAIGRLVQIQLVRNAYYVNKAIRQQERTIVLTPVRGSILDAKGRVLAESVSVQSVYADPQAIVDRGAAAKALSAIPEMNLSAAEVDQKLRSPNGFVWLARQVSVQTGESVRNLKLAGVYLLDEHGRSYPRGKVASNVIGYVGLDGEGLSGIEHSLDAHVRGKAGKVTLLRDARRGMYLVGGEGANRPVDGHDVVLTIDSVVEFIAERALEKAVEKYDALGGSVIVMDPKTGDILAMASWPTFDPNHYRDYPPESWKNRNIQDTYEPGSTFKIVTASAGLEEGLITPSQIIDCGDGSIQIGNVAIHEHGHGHYGLISFEEVMVHSSNVGAIRVGLSLGQERFYRYLRKFGFGERTGVPLPGETAGTLRRIDRWSQLSNASMSIGQEIGVTPIQLMRAVATVANGGVRVEPRLVDRVLDSKGDVLWRPQPPAPQRVISEKTAAVLNEILKAVVVRGTGVNAALADHIVAGKTGTAQKAGRGGYGDKVIASFAGYVPADRPRLAMLVVVDEPKGAQYGGTIAAPVFKEIAESTLRYLGVPPSLPTRTIDAPEALLASYAGAPASRAGTGVPDVRGLDARAAVLAAATAGLTVRATGSGVVTSQLPVAGAPLPADRRMVLTLVARTASLADAVQALPSLEVAR